MTAHEIMQEWDAEAGITPRTIADLDRDVQGGLHAGPWAGYAEWCEMLAADDTLAILAGRAMWGLPALS